MSNLLKDGRIMKRLWKMEDNMFTRCTIRPTDKYFRSDFGIASMTSDSHLTLKACVARGSFVIRENTAGKYKS